MASMVFLGRAHLIVIHIDEFYLMASLSKHLCNADSHGAGTQKRNFLLVCHHGLNYLSVRLRINIRRIYTPGREHPY